jgi:hypothetical protein
MHIAAAARIEQFWLLLLLWMFMVHVLPVWLCQWFHMRIASYAVAHIADKVTRSQGEAGHQSSHDHWFGNVMTTMTC